MWSSPAHFIDVDRIQVADFNMSRMRVVWGRIWRVLSSHFVEAQEQVHRNLPKFCFLWLILYIAQEEPVHWRVQVATHPNVRVSHYAPWLLFYLLNSYWFKMHKNKPLCNSIAGQCRNLIWRTFASLLNSSQHGIIKLDLNDLNCIAAWVAWVFVSGHGFFAATDNEVSGERWVGWIQLPVNSWFLTAGMQHHCG